MFVKIFGLLLLLTSTGFACPPVSYVIVANLSARPIEAELKFKEKIRQGRIMAFAKVRNLDSKKSVSFDRIEPWLSFEDLKEFHSDSLINNAENKTVKVKLLPQEAIRFQEFESDFFKFTKADFYLENVILIADQKIFQYGGDTLLSSFGQRDLNTNDTLYYLQYR